MSNRSALCLRVWRSQHRGHFGASELGVTGLKPSVGWISVTEINGEPSPDAGLNFFEGQCCHLAAVMVSNQHGRDSNWNRMPKLDQLRHSHCPPTDTAKQQQTVQKQRFSKIVDCPNFCPTFVKNCLKFLKDPINLDFFLPAWLKNEFLSQFLNL